MSYMTEHVFILGETAFHVFVVCKEYNIGITDLQ